MSRQFTLIILLGLIGLFALTTYQLLVPFLLPLFLAAVLNIMVRPVKRYFLGKFGGHVRRAAAATTLVVLTIVLLPAGVCTFIATVQLYDFSQRHVDEWKSPSTVAPMLQQKLTWLRHSLHVTFMPEKSQEEFDARLRTLEQNALTGIKGSLAEMAGKTPGILGGVFAAIIDSGIVILALYFFLADGDSFVQTMERLIPFPPEYQQRLRQRFESVTRAVVLGTLLAAIAQGFATGVALSCVGFRQWILLSGLATVAAIVPFVGTSLVWIPCAAWLALTNLSGSWLSILGLAFFQVVVVGMLDNLIRAYVLNSDVKLHPLVALLSVMGGLQWIGLWGIFIGPIVASVLQALAEILHDELSNSDRGLSGPPVPVSHTIPPG